MNAPSTELPTYWVGEAPLTADSLVELACGRVQAELRPDGPAFSRLQQEREGFVRALQRGDTVYGVTTGFGDSCETRIPADQQGDLPYNLFRFHGCGTGQSFSHEQAGAIVAARIAALANGGSAVRPEVLQGLCTLLNHRYVPQIPSEGSVGASGDLTPLSYVAAMLSGEGTVLAPSHAPVPAGEALAHVGQPPMRLHPKESLALMNGTSAMAGLACLAHRGAERLARLAAACTAMATDAMEGQRCHFDPRIALLKPHPGQLTATRWIGEDLEYLPETASAGRRLQERYSLRCAPQVIGVLLDNLAAAKPTLEIELNGSSDNPLFDLETGEVLHGGNFYGGHVTSVMDTVKASVASIADLLDRQLALLCNPTTNNGLPANLVHPDAGPAHHGFKAMQITASALTAEALKLTMPAGSFSRSTENHNQDKVSMGTIATRDCLRIIELTETVAVIHSLALAQALELKGPDYHHLRSRQMLAALRQTAALNTRDRAMDVDIQGVLQQLRRGKLPAGAEAERSTIDHAT